VKDVEQFVRGYQLGKNAALWFSYEPDIKSRNVDFQKGFCRGYREKRYKIEERLYEPRRDE